jgi:hypothetical protein
VTPRDFLNDIVRPNLEEFQLNNSCLRHAVNAVATVDALAAYIFHGHLEHVFADDSAYRDALAKQNESFASLRDIAKAQKHVRLTRGNPRVDSAERVQVRSFGAYGEGGYGMTPYGGTSDIVVDVAPGDDRDLREILTGATAFLESEMTRLGI